ncbi:hypothetical protein SDC9_163849 [bioreactor metagenome]|uniref:Uncharacterized protein n=1 Tax=bioreactor metagenome TaxID=1076179 RepID=A0A645FQ01_9ZZZZ
MRGARRKGVELHLRHALVCVHQQPQIEVLFVADLGFRLVIEHGDVRARLHMPRDHLVKRHIKDGMAAGEDDILLRAATHIPQAGADSVHAPAIEPRVSLGHERRQQEEAFTLSVQVPFLAGAEMIHQRMIVFLRNEANAGDAGVDQIRKDKVDAAISAAKGNRGHGARECKVAQQRVGFSCVDEAKRVTCHSIFLRSHPRLQPCPGADMHRFEC